MLKLNILLFVLLSVLAFTIYADEIPSTLKLEAIIFDQHPSLDSNFEPEGGNLTPGLVKTSLNQVSRVPELVSTAQTALNNQGRIKSPTTFKWWFASNPATNVPIQSPMVLNYQDRSGVYSYSNSYFFPIDGKGWDATGKYRIYSNGSVNHNFHFCLKINSKFTYKGTEEFLFVGDDDVWVFIDNKLAVDLGGLHSREQASINLKSSTLGLKVDKTYNFDFFYCERHTTASNMRIDTNLEVFCPYYDYCGVCSGDGSTCCNAATTCNDNKPCTIDTCPPWNTVIDSGKSISDYCSHTPKSCPNDNQCYTGSCNTANGNCQQTKITCPPIACQVLIGCNNSTGCQYKPKCSGPCNTGKCDAQGECIARDCQGSDPCKVYSCDPNSGCSMVDKCPQLDNPCIIASCSANGTCINTDISQGGKCCKDDCDDKLKPCQYGTCDTDGKCIVHEKDLEDGNLCTIGKCDPATGVVSQDPVVCDGCKDCAEGNCIQVDANCDDSNFCTIDACSASGNCTYTPTNCDDQDPCTIDTCDAKEGKCVHTPLVCPDEGNCQVGYCSAGECKVKPRECPATGAFCLITECDEAAGCIVYDKRCTSDNPKCQRGVCSNETAECVSRDYDPKPFICKTAAVVSTAVIAGVTVAGAVALGLAIFGGKKGYDYWKETHDNKISMATENPLYVQNPASAENPLYTGNT
ncbi:hypothetical protein CYY_000426 [Polysphondylium violaceum]|uniref:PA14 domain-containing protein n=1 Tax=Polysphondylium violaceum TaxID=133409 RepID=A0A8J4QAW5_9MYCE|nr:hypothetical protein CYY_000426 [Polysphondylium violaceum]